MHIIASMLVMLNAERLVAFGEVQRCRLVFVMIPRTRCGRGRRLRGVVYIVRVLPARSTDVVRWMDAQGVQHLTCVRGIPSDHSAATRQPKQR